VEGASLTSPVSDIPWMGLGADFSSFFRKLSMLRMVDVI
jgi:hypothetical protein